MNAGLGAAYLAIDAPLFIQTAKPRPIDMDFAHEVKVAFTCYDQARRLNSTRFQEAFETYGQPFT